MNMLYTSLAIISLSILATKVVFLSTMSSWLPLVLVLTFSSGMMTLFTYVTSLSSNQKVKKSMTKGWVVMIMVTLCMMTPTTKISTENMKTFSSNTMILFMAVLLILILVSITSMSHHPNSTLTSTY